MKKIISIILSVCMILAVGSAGFVWADAAGGNSIPGTLVYWAFTNMDKTLTFSGLGNIPNYSNKDSNGIIGPQYPWKGNPYKKVVFEDGIYGIGNYALSSSKYLENITVPDDMTILGEGAFYNCEALKSAKIGTGIKNVPKYAFTGCSVLDTVTLPNGISSIGEYAFKNCSALSTMAIPDSVKEIKEEAFSGTALATLNMPKNLEKIGNKAFSQCANLSEVTINDKLTSIGENAFLGCGSLKSVTIPPTVKTIGRHAFGYMNSTKTYSDFVIKGYADTAAKKYADENGITFNSLGEYYGGEVSEGIKWNFDTDTKTLTITGTGSMETSYSADNLPVYIQKFGKEIQKIVISDGIEYVSDYAFYNLGENCEIAPLPDGITIGDYSFYNTGMYVAFAGDVTSVGEKGIGQYSNGILDDEFTVIGERFTNVESFAEDNHYNFMFTLPTVLEGNCGEKATWKYSIEDKKLEINGSGAIKDYTLDELPVYSKYDVDTLVISDEITEIGDYALFGLDNIKNVEIKPDVTKIGDYALGYTYSNAKEVVKIGGFTVRGYSNSQAHVYAIENTFDFFSLGVYIYTKGTLGETSWSYDENSKTLTVSDKGSTGDCTLDDIPVFSTYDIEKIVIADGVTELGAYVFLNIAAKEIVIASSVTNIKDHSFGYVVSAGTAGAEEASQVEGLVVKGYADSVAEKYANDKGFDFEELLIFALPDKLPVIADKDSKTIYVYADGMTAETFVNACQKSAGITVTVSSDKISTGAKLTVKADEKVLDEYSYTFITMGDVNGDGAINSTDALLILQHTVQQKALTGDALMAGDVKADKIVNSTDALNVLQISVHSITPESLMPTKTKDVA